MPLTDNYIVELDENVTRTPVSYKNRFGITIPRSSSVPVGGVKRTPSSLTNS